MQIVVALGAYLNSFALMIVGRVIFSCVCVCSYQTNTFAHVRLGGENLAVAQNSYTVKWFIGKELCLVFGIQLSFQRFVRYFSPRRLCICHV